MVDLRTAQMFLIKLPPVVCPSSEVIANLEPFVEWLQNAQGGIQSGETRKVNKNICSAIWPAAFSIFFPHPSDLRSRRFWFISPTPESQSEHKWRVVYTPTYTWLYIYCVQSCAYAYATCEEPAARFHLMPSLERTKLSADHGDAPGRTLRLPAGSMQTRRESQ